jgi:hypothetical protein
MLNYLFSSILAFTYYFSISYSKKKTNSSCLWMHRVYLFPTFHYLQFGCTLGTASLSTASCMDVQGVSISTASSMDVQGVFLSTNSSIDLKGVFIPTASSMVWTRRVYPFLLPAGWTCRVYSFLPTQYGREGCIHFHCQQ